jgi:hypothetical protein
MFRNILRSKHFIPNHFMENLCLRSILVGSGNLSRLSLILAWKAILAQKQRQRRIARNDDWRGGSDRKRTKSRHNPSPGKSTGTAGTATAPDPKTLAGAAQNGGQWHGMHLRVNLFSSVLIDGAESSSPAPNFPFADLSRERWPDRALNCFGRVTDRCLRDGAQSLVRRACADSGGLLRFCAPRQGLESALPFRIWRLRFAGLRKSDRFKEGDGR